MSPRPKHGIGEDEGFIPTPTCKTISDGAFEDPVIWSCGKVPGALDWVQIDHVVTFSSDISVWTLYISDSGSLTNTGIGLTITISDIAPKDIPQFDTGILVEGILNLIGTPKTSWTRCQPLLVGATSLTVDACDNWQVGDRIVVGDTRELHVGVQPYLPEVRTITAINNKVINLSIPLTHACPGARDHNGIIERLVPVGNLTRDIVIKSANPLGYRGHILIAGLASATLKYVNISDMGRTTIDALDPIKNHIGRYALHIHHLANFGAATIEGTVVEKSKRWGFTAHASNGNVFKDNIAYNTQGWAFGTEDSTEENNIFENNLAILVLGIGGDYDELIRGTGFWMSGPRNILINNVAMNCTKEGFALYDRTPTRHVLTLNTFRDNESIANYSGITLWGLASDTEMSFIDHLMEWNNGVFGFYSYSINHLTFNNFYSRSDPTTIGTRIKNIMNTFGDYDANAIVFIKPDIQNKDLGFSLPYGNTSPQSGAGERVIQFIEGTYYNSIDFFFMTQAMSSASAQPFKLEFIRPMHGNSNGTHYEKSYHGDGDLIQSYQMFIIDYQKIVDDNFEVFGLCQEPNFIIPQSAPGIIGCPVAGLTNQQSKDTFGVSIYGKIMPIEAILRNNIVGKVLLGPHIPIPPIPVPTPDKGTVRVILANGDIYDGIIVKVP